MTVSRLNVVEGRTKGCQKQVSESDGTASDSVAEAAPSAPVDDQTDAAVDTRPVSNLQKYVHERADMLLARSAVSGIELILFHIIIQLIAVMLFTC